MKADIKNAPGYIKDHVAGITQNAASPLLADGSWCGHGEELYRVYDIVEEGNTVFRLQLPDTASEDSLPPAVRLVSVTGQKQFLIYDPRQHPASWHAFGDNAKKEPQFLNPHQCGKCKGTNFNISVGFEIPADADGPNDTSWFALAIACVQCNTTEITFEDETA